MRVNVRLFAVAKQRAGCSTIALDVSEPATAAALKSALAVAVPALAPLISTWKIAVDAEYVADDRVIPPGAEVAVIPPVSGGSCPSRPHPGPSSSLPR